jgi:hypothetical protein
MPRGSKNISAVLLNGRLNRQWIGIDQSAMSVKVTELRLQKQADLFSSPDTGKAARQHRTQRD